MGFYSDFDVLGIFKVWPYRSFCHSSLHPSQERKKQLSPTLFHFFIQPVHQTNLLSLVLGAIFHSLD